MCINHEMYADDICLLAPSASAMQSLLDVCYTLAISVLSESSCLLSMNDIGFVSCILFLLSVLLMVSHFIFKLFLYIAKVLL